jgi:tight adherence protein B
VNLLPLLTFLAVITGIASIYSTFADLFLRDRSKVNRRIDAEFLKRQQERARKSSLFKDSGQFAVDVSVHDQLDGSARVRFEAMIEQSGLGISASQLLIRAGVGGVAIGLLAGLLTRSIWVAALVALVGVLAPLWYVRRLRDNRLDRLLGQLPDAFELMSRVVRAGRTIPQALQAVADEFQPPLSTEFGLCYEQQNLGLTTEAALRDLARRTGLLEIKIFVLALLVQQQTGGNLAELLDKLSLILRERFQIRGQIRTLTAEGRAQANVLIALPVLMFGFIMFFNREYTNMLLARPQLVVGCLISEAVGALWIRRITNFDF